MTGVHVEACGCFAKGGDVLAEDRVTAERERGDRSGFSGARFAGKEDGIAVQAEGTGV